MRALVRAGRSAGWSGVSGGQRPQRRPLGVARRPAPAPAPAPAPGLQPQPTAPPGACQVIDAETGSLQNVITFPPAGAFVVDSRLAVATPSRCTFQFTAATLRLPGDRALPLPPFGQGWFESVWVDERVRVARDSRWVGTGPGSRRRRPQPRLALRACALWGHTLCCGAPGVGGAPWCCTTPRRASVGAGHFDTFDSHSPARSRSTAGATPSS